MRILSVFKATTFPLLAFLASVSGQALARPNGASDANHDVWEALRSTDLRLGTIVYRLAVANTALCDQREMATGMLLQSIDQFPKPLRAQAAAAFHFELPLGVEAVVPESPAAVAGIHANDSIASIDGLSLDVAVPSQGATTALRDQAIGQIGQTDPDKPVTVVLVRQGQRLVVHVQPVTACRIRAELVLRGGTIAESDDKTIQVGIDQVGPWIDDDIAVLVAHEMAHIVLKHADRLESAGVNHGLFSEFGRNGDLIRAAEDDADRFSVDLLRNAGYDPQIAPRFWLHGAGRKIDPGILRSSTHGSPSQRAAIMQDEIARLEHIQPPQR